jgi:hypothetical protein
MNIDNLPTTLKGGLDPLLCCALMCCHINGPHREIDRSHSKKISQEISVLPWMRRLAEVEGYMHLSMLRMLVHCLVVREGREEKR